MSSKTTITLVGLLIVIALVIGFVVFRRPAEAPGSAPEGPTPRREVSVPEATQEAAPLPGAEQPMQVTQPTQPTTPSPQPEPAPTPASGPQPMPQTVTVRYTGSAFSPSTVTIKKSDTVKFVNESSTSIRIPSNPHPIHTDLPEFDSGSIAPGGTYSFTFTKTGSWGYHNHFSATIVGRVVVQ